MSSFLRSTPARRRYIFPQRQRLSRRADHELVAKTGKRISGRYVELRVAASLLRLPRIGLIVPKYGHSSVERNRLKRHLREIVRLFVLPSVSSLDLAIRVQRQGYDASFQALKMDLLDTCSTLRIRTGDS